MDAAASAVGNELGPIGLWVNGLWVNGLWVNGLWVNDATVRILAVAEKPR